MEGEYLPYDETTAMKLAKDLYRGSGGDTEKAKQMAQYLMNQVVANIDAHAKRVQMKKVSGETFNG